MTTHNKNTPVYYHKTYTRWYNWFAYIYDPFARLWCFLFNGGFGGHDRFRSLIVDWLDPRADDKIIELCSGTGTQSIAIAERLAGKGEVVGIELFPVQIMMAEKKQLPAGLSFIEGDAGNVPFPNNYFDRCVICLALHEIPREVRACILLEARRLIRPGGKIVFVEHNKPDKKWKAKFLDFMEWFNPEYPTYKDLVQHGLVNEVASAGFRIIKREVLFWDLFQIVLAEK